MVSVATTHLVLVAQKQPQTMWKGMSVTVPVTFTKSGGDPTGPPGCNLATLS